jgi:hypothetical protein
MEVWESAWKVRWRSGWKEHTANPDELLEGSIATPLAKKTHCTCLPAFVQRPNVNTCLDECVQYLSIFFPPPPHSLSAPDDLHSMNNHLSSSDANS